MQMVYRRHTIFIKLTIVAEILKGWTVEILDPEGNRITRYKTKASNIDAAFTEGCELIDALLDRNLNVKRC